MDTKNIKTNKKRKRKKKIWNDHLCIFHPTRRVNKDILTRILTAAGTWSLRLRLFQEAVAEAWNMVVAIITHPHTIFEMSELVIDAVHDHFKIVLFDLAASPRFDWPITLATDYFMENDDSFDQFETRRPSPFDYLIELSWLTSKPANIKQLRRHEVFRAVSSSRLFLEVGSG